MYTHYIYIERGRATERERERQRIAERLRFFFLTSRELSFFFLDLREADIEDRREILQLECRERCSCYPIHHD
jgi:hypothetical protein